MKYNQYTTLLAAAMLGFAVQAHGATVSFFTIADTYLRQSTPTTTGQSDTDNEVIVGSISGSPGVRGLIRFDLSALSALGTIQINSVSLIGTNRSVTNGAGTVGNISVFDYGFEFVENTATWNNPDGAGGDTTAGGTLSSTLVATVNHSSSAGAVANFSSESAFTTVVSSALSGDNTVNLLLKRTTETSSNNYARFASREHSDNNPFELAIDYTVVPEPSAALFGGFALLALVLRRRR